LNAPSVPEASSGIHHLSCFERLACCPTPTLCLLLGASCSSGKLVCHPAPALSLCCFRPLRVRCWEFGFLPYHCSLRKVHFSTPTSAVSVILQFTVYVFLRGRMLSLLSGCTGLFSPGVA
jgi:hypothetical protein